MSHPLPRPLYLMIKPPAAVADRLAAGPRTRRAADLLHVTLMPLGDRRQFSDFALAHMIDWMTYVRRPAFRIGFDRILNNGHSVGLRANRLMPGVMDFQAALQAAFARHGVALPPYKFNPHITLNYHSDGQPSAAIEPISWLVEDVRLIESVYGEGRHIEHARFSLVSTRDAKPVPVATADGAQLALDLRVAA